MQSTLVFRDYYNKSPKLGVYQPCRCIACCSGGWKSCAGHWQIPRSQRAHAPWLIVRDVPWCPHRRWKEQARNFSRISCIRPLTPFMKALVGAPIIALSDTTTVGSVTSMEAFGETLPLDAWWLVQVSSLVNVYLLNNWSDSLVVSTETDVCLLWHAKFPPTGKVGLCSHLVGIHSHCGQLTPCS